MAKLEFDKLEDAISYIKENEEKIDNYDTVTTTFENYKNTTTTQLTEVEKKNEELQKANMALYLKTCQDTGESKKVETTEKKVTLDDLIKEM